MFSLCADAPGGGETALNHLGLFLLYQTTAHPSLWALPNKGGKRSVLWMWPYTYNSSVLWWSKIHQGLILLDYHAPVDLMSLPLQELHDVLCAFTAISLVLHGTMQGHANSWNEFLLDFALENPVIQWECEAIKISSFHCNFASQRRQVPYKEGLWSWGRKKDFNVLIWMPKSGAVGFLPYLWRQRWDEMNLPLHLLCILRHLLSSLHLDYYSQQSVVKLFR